MRFVAATAVLVLLLLSQPVHASTGSYSETTTFDSSIVKEFEIDNTEGRTLRISYDIQVIEGAPISIYFVKAEARPNYTQEFYSDWTVLNTTGARRDWEWSDKGVYLLMIVIAEEATEDVTTIEFVVEWMPKGWPFSLSLLYGIIVLIIATVVIVVLAIWRRRSRPPPGEGL